MFIMFRHEEKLTQETLQPLNQHLNELFSAVQDQVQQVHIVQDQVQYRTRYSTVHTVQDQIQYGTHSAEPGTVRYT